MTNKPYFINMEKCHFIYNGHSFEYFNEIERFSSTSFETGSKHTGRALSGNNSIYQATNTS